jgi:adenine-specific DNA-methyltransferase
MAKLEVKEQLKSLLRELFQLDNTDLDFGIYRILNLKSKEVEEFISVQLDAKVEEVKDKILQRQSTDIKTELEAAKKELTDKFQVDFNVDGDIDAKSKQYGQLPLFQEPFNRLKDARERLNVLKVSEDTEKSIYNELYRFFDRYYEGGDFISKPRAGKNNYLIPYEGEEVKLYWANHDQYYIKTGENFKNYVFNNQSADPASLTQVEFKIIDAEVAVNNNKEEKGRLFIPTENPIEWLPEERKLLVKFYYKVPNAEEKKLYGDKQSVKTDNKGINQRLFAIISAKIKEINDKELLLFSGKTRATTKGDAQPIIQYHLERYTTVNKFDYFIHKNLKEFLSRELDFFLKNEVLSIQFLNIEWSENEIQEAIKNNLLKASCIRELAAKNGQIDHLTPD